MEFKPSASHPDRAESQHHRQRLLQIWLPLGAAVLIVIGVAVWTAISAGSPGPTMTKWADISAIWLIVPLCMGGLVFLLLLGLFIYLNVRIYRRLPVLDRQIQDVFFRIEKGVRRVADRVVEPIYTVNGWSASWKTLIERLFRR